VTPGPYCFCAKAGIATKASASAANATDVERFLRVIRVLPF
jgi:hypothetical protein